MSACGIEYDQCHANPVKPLSRSPVVRRYPSTANQMKSEVISMRIEAEVTLDGVDMLLTITKRALKKQIPNILDATAAEVKQHLMSLRDFEITLDSRSNITEIKV